MSVTRLDHSGLASGGGPAFPLVRKTESLAAPFGIDRVEVCLIYQARPSKMRLAPRVMSRRLTDEGIGPSTTSARRYRAGLVRRVRMDFERYRQSESAEQAQRLRRQVQSEILADKQTDMKLCYASTASELLQECV